MLFFSSLALATTLAGDALSLSWNSGGTLNDSADAAGLRAMHGEAWVEWLYAGTPWQVWMLEYEVEGEARGVYSASSVGTTAFVYSGEELSEEGRLGMRWSYASPDLAIGKTESFAVGGRAVVVSFVVRNDSAHAVDLMRVLYGMDPDPEYGANGGYNAALDVLDLDGDGVDDYVEAVAPTLGYALSMGGCGPDDFLLGSWSDWQYAVDADVAMLDGDRAESDSAFGGLWWPEGSLAPGRSRAFTMVVATGDTREGAQAVFADEASRACCDQDLDGEASVACGGADCDDGDPSVAPGMPDEPYDGVDADCAGNADGDVDGDGETAAEAGGLDCDDADAAVNTSAEEVWYDGVDQNCDGNEDDQDFDGFSLAHDCDDADESLHEGCPTEEVDTGELSADGCGCAAGSPGASAAVVVGALLLARRRRAG